MKTYLYSFIIILIVSCSKSEPANVINPGTNTDTIPDSIPNLNPDSATIVIIGSSTAAGTGASPSDSAWVKRLIQLTADNKKKLTWYNLALGGYTTYQGMPVGFGPSGRPVADTLRNITRALSLRPSLVIVSYPTNDVANNYTDEEIMRNYGELVRLMDSAKVTCILMGTQPRDFKTLAQRTRLKTLNEKMKTAYGYRFDNVFDTLAAPDLTISAALRFGDGVHVNNTGHRMIMQTIWAHALFQKVITP